MSLELVLYLASVADKLPGVLGGLSFMLVIVTIISGIVYLCSIERPRSDDDQLRAKTASKWLKGSLTAIFLISTLSVLIPNSKTIYMMAGVSIAKDIISSETGQKLKKIVDYKLDEIIDDMTKEKKK